MGTELECMMDGWLSMPVFESSRKVQVSGSSLALTLPAMFVKACEIEKGSVINVLYDLDGVLVLFQSEDIESIREYLVEIIDKIEKKVKSKDTLVPASDQ